MIAAYRAELDPPFLPLGRGAGGIAVQRVQEWLCLHGRGVAIDGDFGPATERALSDFQRDDRREPSGAVDATTWSLLTHDLAVSGALLQHARTFDSAVVELAAWHLNVKAREAGGDNRGPWVRHYCRGQSVAWCQGFASTVWADAARLLNDEPPLELVLDGIWCLFVPRMVQEARRNGRFVSGEGGAVKPTPGSMFFLRGGPYGYLHVGIVEAAHDDGTMTTIEGNTNHDGSANGYEVARRVRQIASSDFAML